MQILIQDILAVLPSEDGLQTKICSVYIEDGKIAAIDHAPDNFRANKTIFGNGKLLIPGLINAHTHAYMSLFKNYADDLPFNDWLFGRIMPMEDKLTGEDSYWTTLLGCMEMISTGTTSFLDMHMFPGDVPRAICDVGMRAVLSRGLAGGAEDPQGGDRRIREALDEIQDWKHRENLSFMLGPHAPYTGDEGYFKEVAALSRKTGLGIHIHLAESESEMCTVREKYGCSPIELADRCGLLSETTVIAHCVHLSEADRDILVRRGASVVTCPASNLKLANGIAPIADLLRRGINIALGTDGSSSNNALSLFRDLSLVTLLHKGVTGDPKSVSARQGFLMATANGARALGLADKIGEIRPGMAADLAILDLDRPNLQPIHDPIAALCYSASGNEVETVLIGGKTVYENGKFTTVDPKQVYAEVERICKKIGMR